MPAKVYFDSGSAVIGAQGAQALQAAAEGVTGEATRRVAITGDTDKTGDPSSNERLAKDRALAVRAALGTAAVPADRIELKPPAFVETGVDGAEGEARRVDINAN